MLRIEPDSDKLSRLQVQTDQSQDGSKKLETGGANLSDDFSTDSTVRLKGDATAFQRIRSVSDPPLPTGNQIASAGAPILGPLNQHVAPQTMSSAANEGLGAMDARPIKQLPVQGIVFRRPDKPGWTVSLFVSSERSRF